MSQQSPGRVRWPWVAVAFVAVVIAAVIMVVILRSGNATTSGGPTTSGAGSAPPTAVPISASAASGSLSGTPTGASSSTIAAGSPSSVASDPILSQGYVPLYPFKGVAEARAWERSYRQGGHQAWHLSASMTAQSFVAFLRFTEIDQITSRSVRADGAHIGVGYRDPTNALRTAAVLHLVRYGNDSLAPWEVVGSDDTTFTFDTPSYGSHARSPLRVGGRITGVDENVNLAVYQLFVQAPLGQTSHGTPAGGTAAPWSTTVSYSGARHDAALIVAAWTGGHLQRVERFAIDGLYP